MSQKLKNDHDLDAVDDEEQERIEKNYFIMSDGYMKFGPEKVFLNVHFKRFADSIYDFEVRPSDTFVMTYPKSGTTWTQDILWNLVYNPDLDNPDAKISLDYKFPNFETDMDLMTTGATKLDPTSLIMKTFRSKCPGEDPNSGIILNLTRVASDPRTIKTHLPLSLAPSNLLTAKVVYVARDPRDVVISFYHFMKLHLLFDFKGEFNEFFEDFIADRMIYSPYWEHVRSAWEKRTHPNLLFLFYEDLKTDIKAQVKRIDQFLGTNRTDQQIDNVIEFTKFDTMKERYKDCPPTCEKVLFNREVEKKEGGFFRKGMSQQWKEDMTAKQIEKINAWMEKNLKKFSNDFKFKV